MSSRRLLVGVTMVVAAAVPWRQGRAAVPEHRMSAATCIAPAGERREHPHYIFSFRNSCRKAMLVSVCVDLHDGRKPAWGSNDVPAHDTADFRFHYDGKGPRPTLIGWREGGGNACR
jgi:hypothetical protein